MPLAPAFPDPVYFGARRHWALSALVAYERELAGLPPEPFDPNQEQFLTAAAVRKRYGNVSAMWLHRRLQARRAASGDARDAMTSDRHGVVARQTRDDIRSD